MLNHLKRSILVLAAAAAVSLAGTAAPASAAGDWDYLLPPYGACGTAAEGDMSKTYSQWTTGAMCLVNAARTNYGRQPYTTYMNLLDSAYKKASDISVCQPDIDTYVTGPDGSPTWVGHYACNRPMDYHHRWLRPCAGTPEFRENIHIGWGTASNYSNAREAVSGWLNSDRHRAVLLSPNYTAHGVMYSGPTTYPKMGPNARIWVHHVGHCG
jgi:cysteine-rich secretory family protein